MLVLDSIGWHWIVLVSILFLLSSPIGNLKDMSQRFVETLNLVDVLYCEDTRVTGNLLSKLQIKKPLRRYDEHVEERLIPEIMEELRNGKNIGLITDAGIPAISDPGFKLIRECVKNNIKFENIPGPSAITSALLVSGLPTDHFMFFGFLPKTEAHVKQVFEKMKQINEIQKTTFVFFESPFRILKTLLWLNEVAPQSQVAVCRELTKMHEEVLRGAPEEVYGILSSRPGVKGEITVCLSFSFT